MRVSRYGGSLTAHSTVSALHCSCGARGWVSVLFHVGGCDLVDVLQEAGCFRLMAWGGPRTGL